MKEEKHTSGERQSDTKQNASQQSANTKHSSGMSRRSFVLGAGGAAVLVGLGAVKFANPKVMVRPPGGQDDGQLIGACIRCERCAESCPRRVISLTHLEDGLINVRTPKMNFNDDYCDFCQEENGGDPLCIRNCPTQALKLPMGIRAQDTRIGVAYLNTDWCLAYKLLGCRNCYDACPYEAICLDDQNRPVVEPEKCNGCGACEASCVSLENGSISEGETARAITVQPLDEK